MANQKLNATITIGAVLGTKTAKTFGVLKGGLGQVNQSIKEVTHRQKELSAQRKVLQREGKDVSALDKEYEDLEQQLKSLTKQQNKWSNAIGRSKEVGHSWGKLIGNVKRTGAILGGFTAAGTASVLSLSNSVADAGREVVAFSRLANATPLEFQRWSAAANTVGIEQDKLSDILKDVNDRVGDFLQTGGGPMADFFENIGPKVGVTAKHFKGLSGPDALQLYVSSLQKAGVNQQEMVFYLEAMASDATALLPLLADNGKELQRLGDQAERTGQVMDEKALAAAKEYQSTMGQMRGTLLGVRNTLGTALLPVVTQTAREFSNFILGNSENIKQFGSRLTGMAGTVIPIIKDVSIGFGKLIATTSNLTKSVSNMVGGWQNFGMIIGGVFAAKTLVSIGGFVGSVFKLGSALLSITRFTPLVVGGIRAIGMAFAANPIGLAITAIAGGAYLIYRNWGSISTWFTQKWGQVKAAFSNAWAGIKALFFNYTPHGLVIKHWATISSWFTTLWKGISTGVTTAWTGIKTSLAQFGPTTLITNAWDSVSGYFSTLWDGVKTTFTTKWDAIKTATASWITDFTSIGDNIILGLKGGISSGVEGVKTAITDIGNSVMTTFKSLLGINSPSTVFSDFGGWIMDGLKNGIMAKFEAVKTAISGVASGVTNWFREKLGLGPAEVSVVGANSPKEGGPQRNATGGIFGARPMIVGERGPEIYFPNRGGYIATNEQLNQMEAMARNAVGRQSAPRASNASHTENHIYHIHVQTESSQKAREVLAEIEKQKRQASGGRLFDQNSLRVG